MKKGPPVIEVDIDSLTPAGVRNAFIVRFGSQCAGWLVNRFRKRIVNAGEFRLRLDAREELPPWADIAISYLKGRPRWLVTEEKPSRGVRYWVIAWLPSKRRRRIPPVLRLV